MKWATVLAIAVWLFLGSDQVTSQLKFTCKNTTYVHVRPKMRRSKLTIRTIQTLKPEVRLHLLGILADYPLRGISTYTEVKKNKNKKPRHAAWVSLNVVCSSSLSTETTDTIIYVLITLLLQQEYVAQCLHTRRWPREWPPRWPSGYGVRLESERFRVRFPLAPGFFQGRVIPVT